VSKGISVVVPTYKRPDLLFRCLSSIALQTFKDYEIIVVDNEPGENDIGLQIGRLKNEKIRYVQEMSPGVSAARNAGINVARSELIVFVDDDDEIDPCMLQSMYEFMTHPEHSDISFSWTGVVKLFEKNNSLIEKREFLVSDSDLLNMSFIVKIGTGCGLCVRRNALLEVGCFDSEYKLSEDRDLLIKLIAAGKKYKPLNEFLYRRYYHCGERLSQSLHALEEAEHDYKLYYEHLSFIMKHPVLRLRLLDLRARHYFEGGELDKAVEIAFHAWQIQPYRVRSVRRLISYWLKAVLMKRPSIKTDVV